MSGFVHWGIASFIFKKNWMTRTLPQTLGQSHYSWGVDCIGVKNKILTFPGCAQQSWWLHVTFAVHNRPTIGLGYNAYVKRIESESIVCIVTLGLMRAQP